MYHPNPSGKKFAVFERFRRSEFHLRSIGLGNLQLAFELGLISRRLSGMIPIRDD